MNRDEINQDIAAQLRVAANWPGHDRDGLLAKADQVLGFTRPLYPDYSAIEADLPLLLKAAWVALRDAELFDLVAEETDTSDDELPAVRDRLHRFIAVGFPVGSTGSPLARALAAVPGYPVGEPVDGFSVMMAMKLLNGDQPRGTNQEDWRAGIAYVQAVRLAKEQFAPDSTELSLFGRQAADAVYQDG